jgi:DNA-binding transcriptional MerR regulator
MGLSPETERQLMELKGKEFLMADFIKHGGRLIPALVEKQVRYKVTDIPDIRTVRYYVQRGFVDKPSRRGRQVVFGYRHLLQVLVLKKLQSRYLPLRKIEEVVRLCDRDLEEFLTVEWPENKFLRSLAGLRPSATNLRLKDDDTRLAPLAPFPVAPGGTVWRRFGIDDDLELLVGERFDINAAAVSGVIAGRIMQVLYNLSAEKEDRTLHGADGLASLARDDGFHALPAPPVPYLADAVVALITEGGLVPRGNPDRLEAHRASRFLKYNIDGIADLERDAYESVTGGWDTTYVNADPDRLLPLDVMRELERKRVIGKTHHYFYTTTGVAMSIEMARNIGKALAVDLKREGVTAAILTAT